VILSKVIVAEFIETIMKKHPKLELIEEDFCEILLRHKYNPEEAIKFCDKSNSEFKYYMISKSS
jgi:hypothetical protein